MPTYDEVFSKIIDLLKSMVVKDDFQITADVDLVNDLGFDSLKVMALLELLEDNFDISIPISILPGITTVKDLAVEIQKLTEN